ncbi:hypothetical protein TNCV_3481521 [Trichonephila clavipes]|nr:hypothetical protein TNCV_3481521 [Trichonephila clavipes]
MIKAATEIVEKKQNLSSDIVKCGISVDGTWQRRGYTSMNGCVAAISVDTGKVLDIEVMSSYCPTCVGNASPFSVGRGKCVTLFGGVRGTPRNSSACKQQQGRYTNYCCNPYGKAAPHH